MYEHFWQLDRNPFDNDDDLRGFYRSETHQATLLKLRYLVENGKGMGLLAGGTGFGKSYLIDVLTHQLGESHGPFIHLVFPQMSPAELLNYLAVEFPGSDLDAPGQQASRGLDHTIHEIERRLMREFSGDGEKRHPVIVVDEAHLIEDLQVFQALRLLLNFQDHHTCRFSLIFVGQRELLNTVRRLGHASKSGCRSNACSGPSAEETAHYVAHRLEAAGANRPIFEPTAMQPLHELSGGVPRRINRRLCDLLLLVGFADDSSSISAEQVEAVGQELTAVVPD